MTLKLSEIIKKIEDWLPSKYAMPNDKIGLLTGSREQPIKRVLVTLDLDQRVLEEAIGGQVDLIFAHHNPFYAALNSFSSDSPKGKLLMGLIKNDIALYAAHTNLDSVDGGVNDILADLLSLENRSILVDGWKEKYYKLAVNLPIEYEEKVRKAIADAGAGQLGDYSDCTFHIKGDGYFKPLEGSDPFIGSHDDLSQVEEVKIETIVASQKLQPAIDAMLAAHPYEEVAYDILPLLNEGQKNGLGRIGYLKEPMKLEEFLTMLKQVLELDLVKHTGNPQSLVHKIALCGGSGMSFYQDALKQGADLYLTGDIKYHDAQDARDLGLILVDAGHYATERPLVKKVNEFFIQTFQDQLELTISQVNTNPFVYYKG